MKRILSTLFAFLFLSASYASAQWAYHPGHIVLVIPFENTSKSPGIEWIGEAFSEVLGNRMSAANLFVIRREDRIYAFDRLGIPANIRPSRATLFRVAEEMDVDYVVLGSYNFDGRTFTTRAQLLDMKRVRLSPEAVESGGLTQLVDIQNAVAWDLLRDMGSGVAGAKSAYLAASSPIRLDALEDYIRGTLASDVAARIKYLKDAVRVSPDYSQAMFQLGKTYFDNKEYEPAAIWFNKIPRTQPTAREANFYSGMAYYYNGDFEKANEAFSFVAQRVPLIEVYNNLGVIASRRGKKNAVEYFQRVVQADSRDPDYRFNLAVALFRSGDTDGAARQLKEALAIKPQDPEAKSLLDALSSPGKPTVAKLPLERIKSNYDETSYRQLAMEIQNATEERHAALSPLEHSTIHQQRGEDFLKEGLLDQAESEFREAILLDQSAPDAHAGLARALEEQDELPEARAEAVAANRLKFSADGFLTLAKIDMKQSRLESARDNVGRALKIDPNNALGIDMQKTITLQMAQKSRPGQSERP